MINIGYFDGTYFNIEWQNVPIPKRLEEKTLNFVSETK